MQCPVAHSRTSQEPSGRSAGKCPFSHGTGGHAQPTSVAAGDQQGRENAGSTVTGESRDSSDAVAALNGCPFGYPPSEPVREPSGAAARCPIGHGQQQSNGGPSAEQDSAPAQCPMGFTAADGPRMTQFHCVICKSLLYDCVQLSCSCKYCRYCVAAFHDCPLCGADITSRTHEPKLQGAGSCASCAIQYSCNQQLLLLPLITCELLFGSLKLLRLQVWWTSISRLMLAHKTYLTLANQTAPCR